MELNDAELAKHEQLNKMLRDQKSKLMGGSDDRAKLDDMKYQNEQKEKKIKDFQEQNKTIEKEIEKAYKVKPISYAPEVLPKPVSDGFPSPQRISPIPEPSPVVYGGSAKSAPSQTIVDQNKDFSRLSLELNRVRGDNVQCQMQIDKASRVLKQLERTLTQAIDHLSPNEQTLSAYLKQVRDGCIESADTKFISSKKIEEATSCLRQ